MSQSIYFQVALDSFQTRWMNALRAVGAVGLGLLVLSVLLRRLGWGTLADLIFYPGALLGAANVVWVYALPALCMSALYSVTAFFLYVLNMLHVLVLQRNNEELVYYQTRYMYMRVRLFLYALGISDRVPHVDLYARNGGVRGFELQFRAATEIPVIRVLIRLIILIVLALCAFAVLRIFEWAIEFHTITAVLAGIVGGFAGLLIAVYLLSIVFIWIYNAFSGQYPTWLVDFHLRLMRLRLTIESYFNLTINRPEEFRGALRSVLDEEPPADRGQNDWINPADPRRVDINLVALMLLVFTTGGLYLLIWLARTAGIMGDDPFTIMMVCILGGLLPLSIMFARYYRRLEKKAGQEPGVLLELIMILPFVNLICGPFLIQYFFNLTRRSARRSD